MTLIHMVLIFLIIPIVYALLYAYLPEKRAKRFSKGFIQYMSLLKILPLTKIAEVLNTSKTHKKIKHTNSP